MPKSYFFFSILVCTLISLPGLGEENVLTFRSAPATEEPAPWIIEPIAFMSTKQTTIKLDQGKTEDVYVVEIKGVEYNIDQNPLQVLITQSQPYRLISDINQDRQFQSEEIIIGEDTPTAGIFVFKNIPLPSIIKSVTIPIQVNAQVRFIRNSAYFEITRILSCYEGTIAIGGIQYPTHLISRSYTTYNNIANEMLILDTDRDGKLHSFTDPWLVANGVGYFNDALWKIQTEYRGETAIVSLSPYTGAVGKLKIAGEGFHRAYLRQFSANQRSAYDLCLPSKEDHLYTLPTEQYRIIEAWLQFNREADQYYQLSKTYNPYSPAAELLVTISPDQANSVTIGGPLKKQILVSSSFLTSIVSLDYKNLKNAAGIAFDPVQKNDILQGTRSPAPKWEICNAQNVVIRAGQFAYG